MLPSLMVIILNWRKHFFFTVSFLSAIVNLHYSLSIPFIYLSSGSHFSRKNLPKWVRPKGNWTYDLRLLTHLRPTINATRLLSELRFKILELVLEFCYSLIGQRVFKKEKKYHLRFQRLNSDGNFFKRYNYNIP